MPDTTAAPAMFELEVPMVPTPTGRAMVPPLTANQRLHWRNEASRVRLVREGVTVAARAARIPVCRHLTVQLHYRPADRKARDEDNLYPTFKAACDALARNGRGIGLDLVPDDTPQHMTKLPPVIHTGLGDRRLWITVEVTR